MNKRPVRLEARKIPKPCQGNARKGPSQQNQTAAPNCATTAVGTTYLSGKTEAVRLN